MTADLNARKDKIFDLIVRSYIETAEPVGSRTISKLSDLGLSSASIRNVMADLEETGYLAQPHTSAGRIPTDKGYRYWVDALMRPEELAEEEKEWILRELMKAKTIEALADRVSKVISELTENAALLFIKNLKRVSFLNYLLEELIRAERLQDYFEEESELFVEGVSRIFDQPEFQDARKMRSLIQLFDEKSELLQLLAGDLELEGVHVHIGRENEGMMLESISIVVKDCYIGRTPIGGVAVVGPTRMHYPKAVSVVNFVADSITETMQRF
ncbi:MAG: heat-inducible transcriptional repressor HrcA [Candidatus Omnitrophica bacterium]|nr:heat-inducible transcriptional repressor HrcA [Candidatus Omnitrophota bacterium]